MNIEFQRILAIQFKSSQLANQIAEQITCPHQIIQNQILLVVLKLDQNHQSEIKVFDEIISPILNSQKAIPLPYYFDTPRMIHYAKQLQFEFYDFNQKLPHLNITLNATTNQIQKLKSTEDIVPGLCFKNTLDKPKTYLTINANSSIDFYNTDTNLAMSLAKLWFKFLKRHSKKYLKKYYMAITNDNEELTNTLSLNFNRCFDLTTLEPNQKPFNIIQFESNEDLAYAQYYGG